MKIRNIIRLLKLKPHLEGGYFSESYRAVGKIPKAVLPKQFKGGRNYSTAIYYLLSKGSKSKLHKIPSDEVWHFYLGGSITIIELSKGGKVKKTVLGSNIEKGEKLQYVVPAGCWFGAYPNTYPNAQTEFALVGATVAPGFDFADFEMGNRKVLLRLFPKAHREIHKLT